jgi:hypothetical protein
MKTFEQFINESYNLSENLSVSVLDNKDGLFFVSINGQEYGYKPEGISINDLVDKFKSILKHNAGRALAWLKKNSELVKGSKKNEVEIFESLELNENSSDEMYEIIAAILHAYDNSDSSTQIKIEKFFDKYDINNGQDTDDVVEDCIKSRMRLSDAIDFASDIDAL